MLECGFCGEILSRRTWHTSSIYKKINWQCVRSTKKGKKYCPHSKGIQEAAIEKAFVESYRQLCHADSTIIDDFLKIGNLSAMEKLLSIFNSISPLGFRTAMAVFEGPFIIIPSIKA